MRTQLGIGLAGLIGIAFLPLRTDGGQAECLNGSTSFSSMRNDPVVGDEAFFKLPTGPGNVMFLYDQSGSMDDLPQCPSGSWNSTAAPAGATCRSPVIPAPALPNGSPTPVAVNGTCAPGQGGSGGTAWDLRWMDETPPPPLQKITPKVEYADPGRTNTLLTDAPHWGNGCTGDFCLFDPKATYFYDDWNADATATSNWAIRNNHDDRVDGLPGTCIAVDPATGDPYLDVDGREVDLGAACRTCMDTRGFYFYSFHYVSRRNGTGVADQWNGSGSATPAPITGFIMKGTFLNANPPKFMSARKAVKDVAWINDLIPSKFDQVRMGLTILDSSGSGNRRARLAVPLGPDKTASFPPTQAAFRQARQALLSVMNQDAAVYTDSGGATIIDGGAISGGFFDPTANSTPLASALFNTGQYFSTTGFYSATFGAAYQIASFGEKRAGLINAPWVTGDTTSGQQRTCSICWACQNNSILLITDGMPNSEISLPTSTVNLRTFDNAVYNLAANCGTENIGGTNYTCGSSHLPRVASWLHNTDLRTDMATSAKQAVTVHTVGFAITDNTALKVLRATATMGGGLFQQAKDAGQLADAVYNAVNQVVAKENSFSAASANSLQTVQTAASEAFLTRFKPNQTNTWEGHLFQGALFDEFLNGCDPTKLWDAQPTVSCGGKTVSANFNQDQDSAGNAVCTGVFLIDQDCDEVAEDPQTGDFVKRGTGIAANFPWDAGQVLSDPTKAGYRSADESSARKRSIFTWLNGARVELTTANVAALKPFMNIGATWCNQLLTQIGIAGGADPTTECAKQVIHFVRGWDVLNNDVDSCWGPGNPKNVAGCPSGLNGEERDRVNDGRTSGPVFFKLGDIFHSSPAVVTAPVDEIRCDTGYEKQCVATLHSPAGLPDQTPNPKVDVGGKQVDAYEAYRLDHLTRRRVALVGANDGMLHAFDAGSADTTKTPDPTGAYPYTTGTGEELWAFVPADLLPKLHTLLAAHQYMVDGSVMLRDVWVDHDNPLRSKTRAEFHTVAIFGERSGGTKYTALDVTDPLNPTVRWSFPRDGSPEAHLVGQTWSDFAPRPPPIGPVRIASSADPRGWEERWIVMLNGGYDPALGQGRAVFMVDAWTGATLWRYTDADFKATLGFDTRTSMFPVPAAVALVDVGDTTKANMDIDGFFDTATWGDMGGNAFVARFHEPGQIDPATGLVTNWFAARAFEQQRRPDDRQGVDGRTEFFFMTANAFEPTTRTLRTYLGSGNRERMMDQASTCGTDNLQACCRAGCTVVRGTTFEDFGTCEVTSSFACESGFYLGGVGATAPCAANATCGGAAGTEYSASTTLHWECPGAGVVPDATGTATCDLNGNCTSAQVGTREIQGNLAAQPRNRFYGFWSYGREPRKTFKTAPEARVFDQNRFTDVAYSGSCAGARGGNCKLVETTWADVTYDTANPALVATACSRAVPGQTDCKAVPEDAGWFYEYGNNCPLKTCGPPPPWNDEKTGSGSTVVLGCTAWGGFRPVGAATSTDPCSGSVGAPVTYGYVAHFVSGIPSSSCGYADNGGIYRAVQRSTTAPPTAATVRVTFSPSGEISYSTLQIDAGAAPGSKTMGTRSEIGEPVYWLEVPRQLHACRHVAGSTSCE